MGTQGFQISCKTSVDLERRIKISLLFKGFSDIEFFEVASEPLVHLLEICIALQALVAHIF